MFQIDAMSRVPVYEQIIEQAERFICADIWPAGSQIPSVRSVSLANSVNPRTILKAYNDLDSRGLIQAVPGKGYFVCKDAKEKLREKGRAKLEDLSKLLLELVMSGVTKEEVCAQVEKAYAIQQALGKEGGEVS